MKKVLSVFISVLLSVSFLASCGNKEEKLENDNKPEVKKQIYAADTLLNSDGKFGNDSEGMLRVGFIGGSLTDAESYTTEEGYAFGGKQWTNTVCSYLEEKFPNRKIIPNNSGFGGTTSDYGAVRINETILKFNPDIVFIEYTVNDTGFTTREDSQKYMESMVRMTQNLDKIPVIVFLYTPYPTENTSDTYTKWVTGATWKQEIADYYGIGSINIYDYMQSEYAKTDYPTFLSFLEAESSYSGSESEGFDVHGGYEYYAAAILKAFEERPAEIITKTDFKEDWFENNLYKDIVYTKYVFIKTCDERLKYDGEWTLYNLSNAVTSPDYCDIWPVSHGEYAGLNPSKRKDMMAGTSSGANVTFTTDADAIYACSQGVRDISMMTASIYVDGVFVKSFAPNACTLLTELDGQTHEIKIVTDETELEHPLFWSSNYVEAYKLNRAD